MEKIKQYLNETGYYNLYDNNELFENFIQSLNAETVLQIAVHLNQILRNKENNDVVSNNMVAGELSAPTSDIRVSIINNLLNTVKNMNDNKLRAELVYYTFINLHMFSDGNGRTSRLLYGLLSGKIEGNEWYLHSDSGMQIYEGNFCSYKGMMDESVINQEINQLFSIVVEKYRQKNSFLSNKEIFKTYYGGANGFVVSIDEITSIEIKNQLTDDEKNKIVQILGDNENNYSIAGLTMLITSSLNGQLEEWARRNEEKFKNGVSEDWIRYRLSFNLISNKDLLKKWKIDDWRKLIQIGNELKLMQFSNLNQIYLEKNIKKFHK